MRRIYFTWFVRKVLPVLAVELGVFALIIFTIQSYVSLKDIIETAILRTTHFSLVVIGKYVYESFLQSELIVKALFVGAIFMGIFAIRDTVRISKTLRRNFFGLSRVT